MPRLVHVINILSIQYIIYDMVARCVTQQHKQLPNIINYNTMSAIEEQAEISSALIQIAMTDETCSPRRTLRETVGQQEILISAFRQQILRLQNEAIEQRQRHELLEKQYNDSLETIETQRSKIESLKENNESIMHTFEVFQRQFVKRDYKNLMKVQSEAEKTDGPYFLELIRNMKSKFSSSEQNSKPGEQQIEERSQLNQYYGYFFNEQLEEKETEMYHEINSHQIFDSELRSKLKSFGRKHCFHQRYRPCFWYNALGNNLRITRPLYQMYLNKLETTKAQQKLQDHISLIDRDLNRMDFKLEEEKSSPMKQSIKKCLQIFEIYRPDIGYVQGMSYLAWMILIRFDGYKALTCFSNLVLCDPFVHSLYCFKESRIKRIKEFYEKCMEEKKSKLLKHMTSLQVECELFIIEWAYTMFTRAFNLRISSKIWDLWFSEGYGIFFKSVLVIMDFLEDQILKMNENDKIVEFIRAQTHKIDQIEFIKSIKKQKLPQQLFL